MCQTAPPVCDSQSVAPAYTSATAAQLGFKQAQSLLTFQMTETKPEPDAVNEARCDPETEQTNVKVTDPAEGKKYSAEEDTSRMWMSPTVQGMEEVLYSAPRSCRHCDEVWPNLYLGDM